MGSDKAVTNILSRTTSVCPQCLGQIPACVAERDGAVYLIKQCEIHGEFQLEISQNARDYECMEKAYAYFLSDPMPPSEYYLCATMGCNADCPICFLKQCPADAENLSLAQISRIAADRNVKRLTFSHGEATTCADLPRMIRLLRKHNKIINVHTNGIKLADLEYARLLKSAGISQVSLQFDAFSEDKSADLRGSGSYQCQRAALENLKKLRIPVTLNVTVARGLNIDEIGGILDYGIRERFIKDLSFITYCHYDNDINGMFSRYIMPDEVLSGLAEYSKGRITRRDVIRFQPLFYAYMNVTKTRKCFNYIHYLIVRWRGGYLPVSAFIDLEKAAARLEALAAGKRKLSAGRFIGIILSSLRAKSLLLLPLGLLMLIQRGALQSSGRLLWITLATICDPYKYDTAVARNCGQGIVVNDRVYDSYGAYLIGQIARKKTIS